MILGGECNDKKEDGQILVPGTFCLNERMANGIFRGAVVVVERRRR